MAIEQLIKTGLEKAFDKYFYDELVIGKLAKNETKAIIKKGDEIDVKMPPMVTVSAFDGTDLSDPEEVTTSFAKVKVDKGFSVHFKMSRVEEDYIASAKTEEAQADLIREYCTDAVKQAAAQVDAAYGKLYTRAGHYVDNSGNAISMTATVAKDLLAYMEAKFKRGDGKGHTAWIDGQMVAVVPPEYQFFLGKAADFEYVESGHRKLEKGYIGRLAGWDILVSNNIASPSSGVYYPLFGIKGKTLAGGMSKDLDMMHYVPEKSFDTVYKGYGLYGVGAPRVDFLGTAKISATLSVGS